MREKLLIQSQIILQILFALLEVKNLKMHFPVTSGMFFQRTVAYIKAVDDVSFFVRKGETLGLVGESGCGKTTTGRCILQLYHPTDGEIIFEGKELTKLPSKEMRQMRRDMQVIFQDPYSSLNPRMTAGNIIGEPLIVHKLTASKGCVTPVVAATQVPPWSTVRKISPESPTAKPI